jgi:transcriptional regulator with XRE-family HTH domain
MALDYRALAGDFVRALRASRSQVALSRRLKYSTNVIYAWESGRRSPTAATFFAAELKLNPRAKAALAGFFASTPAWIAEVSLGTPAGIARLLREVRGSTPVVELARRTGFSRFAIARWLSGEAEPRLPDFLKLFESASLRLLDFVAQFHDPDSLPSAQHAWHAVQAHRRAAYELPWLPAVSRALELTSYAALPRHEPGFIARLLGISVEEEERCLALLLASGQIGKKRGRYVPGAPLSVDTRADPQRERQLKAWWSRVGSERLEAGAVGQFSFNVFSVSSADRERLRELHQSYFRQMRAIIAASEPSEHVMVANVQLFELAAPA